ncbi:MAG: Smr/MutS family protein [Halothiobacillaceae bacterium]|nr:Smr/MutS family protein [Halothiobacillaceae bacterium]
MPPKRSNPNPCFAQQNNAMNDEDIQLFHESIGATRGEVRRIQAKAQAPTHPRRPAPRLRPRSRADQHLPPTPHFSDHDPYPPPTLRHEPQNKPVHNDPFAYAKVEFQHASINPQTMRRLRQGKLRIAATLDLHGCHIEEARQRVAWLLQQPSSGRYPGEAVCTRIIHGQGYNSPQGQSKLKRLLQIWLPQSLRVLAFCSARPEDGGQGALYVLLRSTS